MKSKLRVGVIGVGSVVREIYRHLYFNSEFSHLLKIVAVADPNDEFRNWFCDTFDIPPERRFAGHPEMLANVELDAVQVNTPDHIHRDPAVDALEAGMDVVVAKPIASTVRDAHDMILAARKNGRLLGIDFHKRADPRIKEAEARYQSGRYGVFQAAVFYMIDKLLVADPNHEPRFFASPDFAEKNSPVSFLTVHMADALIRILDLRPVEVRATAYAHKLPSLRPRPVKGLDMVDTEIRFENGGTAHVITGWHLPNTAHAPTVQSGRIICSEGMVDLGLDTPGYRELHADALAELNPLFRNFEKDGTVTGYGLSCPGRFYQKFLAAHNGLLSDEDRADMMTPTELGLYTTLVLQGADESLANGIEAAEGVTAGAAVDLADLLRREVGRDAASTYGYGAAER